MNYYVLYLSTIVFGMFLASVAFYEGAKGIWVPELNGYLLIFLNAIPRITFSYSCNDYWHILSLDYYYVHCKTLKIPKNVARVSKIQVALFLFAEVIAIVGSGISSYFIKYLSYSYQLIPFLVLVIIRTILILVSYLISPTIPYLISAQPLYLYVVSSDGITIFSYSFIKQELLDPKNTLVGEIVHAIIQFGKHTLGLYKQLSTVSWGGFILTVETNDNFTVLLVSRRFHHLLQSSLNLFTTYFRKKFGKELKTQAHFKKLNMFDARDLLEKAFPFLALKKENFKTQT